METVIKVDKKQKVQIIATDSIGNELALSFSDLSMLQSNNKEVCDIEQDGDDFLIIAKSNGSTQIVGQYVNEQGLTLTTSLDVIVLDSAVTIVSISFKIGDIID